MEVFGTMHSHGNCNKCKCDIKSVSLCYMTGPYLSRGTDRGRGGRGSSLACPTLLRSSPSRDTAGSTTDVSTTLRNTSVHMVYGICVRVRVCVRARVCACACLC